MNANLIVKTITFLFLSICPLLIKAQLNISTWGYQLDTVIDREVNQSSFDLVVVDEYSDKGLMTSKHINKMQVRADGTKRYVLVYMPIGIAEEYRSYWKDEWFTNPPSWLGPEDVDWEQNYDVNYWEEGWQSILFGTENSVLDQFLNAGYDGIYLDGVDAFESHERKRPSAKQDMIDLVVAMSNYAHSKNPDFLIIPQNGEQLLANSDYLNTIDGIAKEDLYYGYNDDGVINPEDETDWSMQFLDMAKSAGKLVLVMEYLGSENEIKSMFKRARIKGYIPYASNRDLNQLPEYNF